MVHGLCATEAREAVMKHIWVGWKIRDEEKTNTGMPPHISWLEGRGERVWKVGEALELLISIQKVKRQNQSSQKEIECIISLTSPLYIAMH